jgi:serine/threonine-protein kinase
MMSTAARASSFGPYLIQGPIAENDAVELSAAFMFGGDAQGQVVALRRTKLKHGGDHFSEEMLRTAASYAVLHHPNIVEVKDLGTIDGRSYVATDFVRGKSLLSALAACGRLGHGFPTDVALYIASCALDALDYAHGVKGAAGLPLGVIHRDLRHSNVLLSFDGSVRVCDFELGSLSTHQRTERGVCIGGRQGFFSYLSPEQAREESVDARTDVFSLGIILYELVTGRHLFSDREEEALLERLRMGAYELPIARYRPDLNPELESIIRAALSPEPGDRFGSAASFLGALNAFLESVHVSPGPRNLRELMEKLFGTEMNEGDAREDD